MPYGDKPFGIRQIMVTDITGTTQVELPAAQTMVFRPRLTSGELRGSDALQAVAAFIDAFEWQLQAGGISLEALAIITGETIATAGTSPDETKTMTVTAGDAMPYFKVYGKSIGENTTDDIHVLLYKCKMTAMEGQFQDAQFYITNCSGIAVDDGANGIIDVVQNETAADLPTT